MTRSGVSIEVRASLLVLSMFVLVAVFADLLANSVPLVARHDGRWHVLASLTERAPTSTSARTQTTESGGWALWAPVRAGPHGPAAGDEAPPLHHWFGTDSRGRDVLAVTIHGTRTMLIACAVAIALALLIGIPLGWRAAFGSPIWDALLARLVETIGVFPTPVLVALAGLAVPAHRYAVFVGVLGVARALEIARLLRADLLMGQRDPALQADRLLAIADRKRIFEWLGRAAPLVLLSAALAAVSLVAIDAGLTWVGVPVDPNVASWGSLLGDRALSAIGLPAFASVAFTGCLYVLADSTRRLRGRTLGEHAVRGLAVAADRST